MVVMMGIGMRKRDLKLYKGIWMRKWGKWVVEIREFNKCFRIWFGFYFIFEVVVRVYDIVVFYFCGFLVRFNFLEFLVGFISLGGGGDMLVVYIRRKVVEVGVQVDVFGVMVVVKFGESFGGYEDKDNCNGVKSGNGLLEWVDLNKLFDLENLEDDD